MSQGGLYNENAGAAPPGAQGATACYPACALDPRAAFPTEEAWQAYARAYQTVGNILLAGLTLGRSLVVQTAGRAGVTTLYRAVSPAEAAQVLETGTFQAGANSLGGKWFATSAEHAAAWGRAMYGSQPFTVLEAQLPTSSVRGMMQVGKLDGIGPAVYAELEQLGGAVIKVFSP